MAQRTPGEPINETQQTISRWASETFGDGGSDLRVACRANEEMAELLRWLSSDQRDKAAEEIADVVIILCRLATRLDADLIEEVQKKMAINRAREWKKDGTGHGYHKRVMPLEQDAAGILLMVARVASGEHQVAADDAGGLAWIYKYVTDAIAKLGR